MVSQIAAKVGNLQVEKSRKGRKIMNGHDRRRQRITDRIKNSALELFTKDGADQVSMDEIAERAEVSKVTIYKYFHSKEDLHREVISLYIDAILAETEKVLGSDLDFMEKLKFTLTAKLNAPKMADNQTFIELFERDGLGGEGLQNRIKGIMFRFYEEGKRKGFIEESIPFDTLYLFSEIFQAGVKAKLDEMQPVLADPKAFDQLLQVYFFGVFRRK
jgi:AcrR family transcriptional regulator